MLELVTGCCAFLWTLYPVKGIFPKTVTCAPGWTQLSAKYPRSTILGHTNRYKRKSGSSSPSSLFIPEDKSGHFHPYIHQNYRSQRTYPHTSSSQPRPSLSTNQVSYWVDHIPRNPQNWQQDVWCFIYVDHVRFQPNYFFFHWLPINQRMKH